MARAIICLALIAVANAHLCLLYPHQRGSMQDLNLAGANDCLRVVGPCGNMTEETAHVYYSKGDNVSLVFQKNLDHFYKTNPGKFVIAIAQSFDKLEFETILTIADDSEPSLTLYTPIITIPNSFTGPLVLQVQYVTNNPDAPLTFYQCADIRVS